MSFSTATSMHSSNAPTYPARLLMTADTVGGVWTYALELALALAAGGMEVGLATMGRRLDAAQADEAARIPRMEVFESEFALEWMSEPWEQVDAAGEWLLDISAKWKPEIVHLNSYSHGVLPWGCPALCVAHSCVLSWWKAVHGSEVPAAWREYQARVKAGLQAVDTVVAPSAWMMEQARVHYGGFRRTAVIYNGCSLGQPANEKEPFVLAAGRLWDKAKNLSMLAEVAPRLSWPVVIAGDQVSPETREQFNATNSRQPCLQLLGRLPGNGVRHWMSRAGIYAFPARYEPFGLSILEAASAGCALVLGDIPSLRELWEGAAVFVDSDDPEALVSVINALAKDRTRRNEWARLALERSRKFRTEPMRTAYIGLYSEMLQRTPSRKPCARGAAQTAIESSTHAGAPALQERQ